MLGTGALIGLHIALLPMNRIIKTESAMCNERKKFMQETQQAQRTATRTAQNQDKETT